MNMKRVTPIQSLVIAGLFALIMIAILIASQFYYSYAEVTTATNGCFNIGGHPIIEKTGLKMTFFECVTK